MPRQNRRQKVFNRGALRLCWRAWTFVQGVLNAKLFIYRLSYFDLGELGALFGGIRTPKPLVSTGLWHGSVCCYWQLAKQ